MTPGAAPSSCGATGRAARTLATRGALLLPLLVGACGGGGAEEQRRVEPPCGESRVRLERALFAAPLPGGLRLERLAPAAERAARSRYRAEAGRATSGLVTRVVRAGRQREPLAAVVAVSTREPVTREEIVRGFAGRAGGAGRDLRVGGVTATEVESGTRVSLVAAPTRCRVLAVIGDDAAGVRRVAAPLFARAAGR